MCVCMYVCECVYEHENGCVCVGVCVGKGFALYSINNLDYVPSK